MEYVENLIVMLEKAVDIFLQMGPRVREDDE